MLELRELTLQSILIRVILAFFLGGLVGLERGMKNRPAGLRTYMLVCLGSCIVMITNQYVVTVFETGDPVRMAAQVISGIGFLGAGTIIVTRRNQIKGLTTAAGLWAAACIGLTIGIGFYELALIGGLTIFVVLTILHEMDSRMRQKTRLVEVYVELSSGAKLGTFVFYARENNIELSNLQLENDNAPDNTTAFIVTMRCPRHQHREEILHKLRTLKEISYIEEL